VTAPRLEIQLDLIHENARGLVELLAPRGVAVMGVTKATLGSPEIAREMLDAGVNSIGDSRIENIERMRKDGLSTDFTLIRSPMISQADQVVAHADMSHNSEIEVIARLSSAAQRQSRVHGVLLMVELGDLREGISPRDLEGVVRRTLGYPNIEFRGIGTNLACQNGVSPDQENMGVLSSLASSLERSLGLNVGIVSGGNSASLGWVLNTTNIGRINGLRLGESVLLGKDPLHGTLIPGLHSDVFSLVGEVIECQRKPTMPWGQSGQTAFGPPSPRADRGVISQAIVALGHQDIDPIGLEAPAGLSILGASSDHMIIDAGQVPLSVGSEIRFKMNYSALLRAMTSPFVSKSYLRGPRFISAG
jgi:predicted amino acid racemase